MSPGRREASRRLGAARGLLLVVGIASLGLVMLVVVAATGGPGWLCDVYLLAVLATISGYVLLVYRPQRGLVDQVSALEHEAAAVEVALAEVLGRLRAGDLVNSVERSSELPKVLAAAVSNASGALDLLAQQIQASSLEVATAANSVNELASELAAGSSQQAASVVEITAAMEQLARSGSQIADNAATQAELTRQAEESGNAGAVAVEEALAGVEEVKKRIGGIAEGAAALGARSKEVYRVLDLITEIAQETHILSLNAAVEAAATGEHGRRFAVVAEEVRHLAQRSQESVESVRRLLEEFAGSIDATVAATEIGSRDAALVVESARLSAKAIEELRAVSGETAHAAREISLATQHQNAASEEVVLTLKEVSQVVQRMASSLQHFSETADRLNRLGLDIQMLAQSFHLDSTRSLKHLLEGWTRQVVRRLGSWEAVERLLQELVIQQPFVECLYFYDGRLDQAAVSLNHQLLVGRQLPAAGQVGEGFSERPWYRAAVAEGGAILTPLYFSLLTGQQIFTAAAPIYVRGELAGVLGLDVNLDSWAKI